jgi:hypothetical protein
MRGFPSDHAGLARALMLEDGYACIFSPVRLISEGIQLIESFRTNCILVVPEQTTSNWWIHLFTLSLANPIEQFRIPRETWSTVPAQP